MFQYIVPAAYNEPNFFIVENIARRYVLVNFLLMKYILIFVCVYFLFCDTLKEKYTKQS